MRLARAARLLTFVVLIVVPGGLSAQENPPPTVVREFQLEHLDVKQANAIVRSALSPRRVALDERRQVYIVTDTPEQLDRIAELIARIDVPAPQWTVSVVARAAGGSTTLRTATITQGRLEVQYGAVPPATGDSLAVTATITRAPSSEVDIDWTMSLSVEGRPPESARAQETLHDGATVTLLALSDPSQRERLGRLLGKDGVDSLVLEITRRVQAPRADTAVQAGEDTQTTPRSAAP